MNEHPKGSQTDMTLPQPRTYTIRFPLPPRELSPNDRSHYMVKAREKKAYKSECLVVLACELVGHRPLFAKATIQMAFGTAKPPATRWKPEQVKGIGKQYRLKPPSDGRYRGKDEDNCAASAKTLIDSLKGVLIVDDNSDCLRVLPTSIDKTVGPWVEATISETLETK